MGWVVLPYRPCSGGNSVIGEKQFLCYTYNDLWLCALASSTSMKSHCALLTNSNCFEIVSFCLVCFQWCSNPSSLGKCSLQIFESAHVLCLPGKLHYRCFDFGLWLLTAIANDPVVASPQNWSILLSCLFAFSWVESSYRLKSEITTCSPFSALVNTQHGN